MGIKQFYNRVKRFLKYKNKKTGYGPSALANFYLQGKKGIEIGGSYHNRFFLDTLNINTTEQETFYTEEELKNSTAILKVDIVAQGDELPFDDNQWDFVINSHVLEHFFDPIKTINEWLRVIKPDGYLFMIIPNKNVTFDKHKERTTLKELIARHAGLIEDPKRDDHHNIWTLEDILELCQHMGLNVIDQQAKDDKVGNGFTVVIKK